MSEKGKRKNLILIFLTAVCVVTLLVSLYFALKVYFPQRREQDRFGELKQLVEQNKGTEKQDDVSPFYPLEEYNSDFSGWIYIDDTQIDYPVMKSSEDDPEYYLRRDFDKNYSFSGTPFIGGGCTEDSDAFIIYGHNMKNGTMFTDLDKYADAGWAAAHKDFRFFTLNEGRTYRVFAAFKTRIDKSDEFKYYECIGDLSDEEYDDTVAKFLEKSEVALGEVPADGAQILILSTCSYHTENGRFVVAAYRTD